MPQECGAFKCGDLDLQAAAVKRTRRAQWFLINLPMVHKQVELNESKWS